MVKTTTRAAIHIMVGHHLSHISTLFDHLCTSSRTYTYRSTLISSQQIVHVLLFFLTINLQDIRPFYLSRRFKRFRRAGNRYNLCVEHMGQMHEAYLVR